VTKDQIIAGLARRTRDQRTVGVVLAVVRSYAGPASQVSSDWYRSGNSLA
jgi:hypothetical protein